MKRDIKRERALAAEDGTDVRPRVLASPEPTASELAQADEVRERLLAGQDESQRAVIELKQQGYSNTEIAEKTGWNIRKIQRFFKDLHDSLANSGDH
jgi:DNA-directed RNA polymerase specialized sigma24 family protein